MGDPLEDYENQINGAVSEIVSGLSSLHMGEDRVEGAPADAFLDEKFVYAKHAVEHFRQAINLLRIHQQKRDALQRYLIRLAKNNVITIEIYDQIMDMLR